MILSLCPVGLLEAKVPIPRRATFSLWMSTVYLQIFKKKLTVIKTITLSLRIILLLIVRLKRSRSSIRSFT